jgi:hypothetical protein
LGRSLGGGFFCFLHLYALFLSWTLPNPNNFAVLYERATVIASLGDVSQFSLCCVEYLRTDKHPIRRCVGRKEVYCINAGSFRISDGVSRCRVRLCRRDAAQRHGSGHFRGPIRDRSSTHGTIRHRSTFWQLLRVMSIGGRTTGVNSPSSDARHHQPRRLRKKSRSIRSDSASITPDTVSG